MTSSNGHHGYDEDLLASAPAPTKGMVQVSIPQNPKLFSVHRSVFDFSLDMLPTYW
jgi:hypothetical protein